MYKFIPLVIILLFTRTDVWGQQHPVEELKVIDEGMTFTEVRERAKKYFDKHGRGKGSEWKQYKRWEDIRSFEVGEDDKIVGGVASRVLKELRSKKNNATNRSANVGNMTWRSIGPDETYFRYNESRIPGQGRVTTVEFHPTKDSTLFVGTPGGGVWKTEDLGESWVPIMDDMPFIGISAIAIHPEHPDTIYVVTGDGNMGHTYTSGVVRTFDGGETWQQTSLNITNSKTRGFVIKFHPTNYDTLYASFKDGGGLQQRSTDGGETWHEIADLGIYDIEFHPTQPNVMYGSAFQKIYKSEDAGDTWVQLTEGLPTAGTRVELAVTPAEPDYVYALYGKRRAYGIGTFRGLYRSTDAGATFDTMSTTPDILVVDVAHRCLALAAHPMHGDSIIAGSYVTYRSGDGGSTWVQSSTGASDNNGWDNNRYVHVDIHELKYQPGTNLLFVCNDGGMWMSENNGSTWRIISKGIRTGQYYRIASSENNFNTLVAGSQDNGTHFWADVSTGQPEIFGGDGMDCMMDPDDPNVVYFSAHNGSFYRSDEAGTTATNIKPPGATGGWLRPWEMNPLNKNTIYAGYVNDTYKSTDRGNTWTSLGSPAISFIQVCKADTNQIYVVNREVLSVTHDEGMSWDTISTNGLPNARIEAITVNDNDEDDVFVAYGGFEANQRVYRSQDAGLTWTNITGTGILNLPAMSMRYQDNIGNLKEALYLGTMTGIYYYDLEADDGNWEEVGDDLPNAPIRDININYTNLSIRVGTFGRGIWESDLYGAGCDAYPMAVCEEVELKLNKNGLAVNFQDLLDGGSYDYCGIESMYSVPEVLSCADVLNGEDLYLFVEDSNGQKDSCIVDVSVVAGDNPNASRLWIGLADTLWSNECNWSYGGLPEIDESVIIPADQLVYLEDGLLAEMESLDIDFGTTLKISEEGILQITDHTNLGLISFGEVINKGTINVKAAPSASSSFISLNSFINYGTLNVYPTGDDGIFSDAFFKNYGSIHVGDAQHVPHYGILNMGQLINDGGSITITESNLNAVLNNATFQNINNGEIHLGNYTTSTPNAGMVNGQNSSTILNDNSTIVIESANKNGLKLKYGSFTNTNDAILTLRGVQP